MSPELNSEKKRTWTRRTHKPLSPDAVFSPDLVKEIKLKGDAPLTPLKALGLFKLDVDPEQEQVLNSTLSQAYNPIFFQSEDEMVFQSRNIEAFIQLALSQQFHIFLLLKIPREMKQYVLTHPGKVLNELFDEEARRTRRSKKRKEKSAEKAGKAWEK